MRGSCFIDTNLLVYWRDASEPEKQPVAAQWLEELWKRRLGVVSTQVLNEYLVTVTHKLSPGLPWAEAWRDVEALLAWNPVPVDAPLLRQAYSVRERLGLSWWDALIVAGALVSGCRWLLSEDLADGLAVDGLRVVNPFCHALTEVLGQQPSSP